MRVLLVTHDFLPRHRAGVEIHAFQMARGLRERGVDARVFTTEKALAWKEGEILEDRVEGVPVVRMVRNRMFRTFRDTWDYPPAERAFGGVLAGFRPHLVHFHHLLYLSLSLPRLARKAGAGTVFTLHDFWLQCRLMGQRLDPWGELCEKLDGTRCAACLLASPPEKGRVGKRLGAGFLRNLRVFTGLDLGPFARRLSLAWGGGKKHVLPEKESFPPGELDKARTQVEERWKAVFEEVIPNTQVFLSPSRFLLEEMAAFGFPREKLVLFRLGVERMEVRRIPRGKKPRFAYFGTVAPHKGVHILLRAFMGLSDVAELAIHGGAPYHPGYAEFVGRLCREAGAEWTGAYEPGDLASLLAGCDCVVVPSLWFENSPLTILQAGAAGIPAIVSGMGGMAELVEKGGGWTFPPGDTGALRALLVDLAAHPGKLEEEGRKGREIPTVEENVGALQDLYGSLASGEAERERR